MHIKNKLEWLVLSSLSVLLSLIFLVILCTPCHAQVSLRETAEIYKRLYTKNHLPHPTLYLRDDLNINAATYSTYIKVNKGALIFLSKPEMAFVLSHELTHYQYRDARAINNKVETIILKLTHRYTSTYYEDRADYYGSEYAKNIGYSYKSQAHFFKTLEKYYGDQVILNDVHSPDRVRAYNIIHHYKTFQE